MEDKDLYNKIINSIAKEVKKTLNEKAGVIEFDNDAYRREIYQIAKTLKQTTEFNDVLDLGNENISNVKKHTFNLTSLSWIDSIDIYYSHNKSLPFTAFTIAGDKLANDLGLFKIDSGEHIVLGSIYIQDNDEENLSHVLFHEMCHLYDNSKFKQIWMEDEKYYLENNIKYNINQYYFSDDVHKYSIDDIHNIVTECMRFTNFTESHAFIENINFEIFEYLNTHNIKFYHYIDIENMFMKSSKMLYDIYVLEKIVKKILYIDDAIKSSYMLKYQDEINKAYYGFNSFNKLIRYIYKKLHKIVSHARSLFNYYYELNSVAKHIYELDETQKSAIRNFPVYEGSKRQMN